MTRERFAVGTLTQLIVQDTGGAVAYQAAKVTRVSDGTISFKTTGGEDYTMIVGDESIVPGTQPGFRFPVRPADMVVWKVTGISDDMVQMETPEGDDVTMAIDGKCMYPPDDCDAPFWREEGGLGEAG
jgi:hypothetical protein